MFGKNQFDLAMQPHDSHEIGFSLLLIGQKMEFSSEYFAARYRWRPEDLPYVIKTTAVRSEPCGNRNANSIVGSLPGNWATRSQGNREIGTLVAVACPSRVESFSSDRSVSESLQPLRSPFTVAIAFRAFSPDNRPRGDPNRD